MGYSFYSDFDFNPEPMKRNKKTPSVTDQWVKIETKNQYKKDAAEVLAKAKKQDSAKPGKWVLVSKFPNTYRKIVQ
jgi:hypothetical protein